MTPGGLQLQGGQETQHWLLRVHSNWLGKGHMILGLADQSLH
jgi:hypothetical protein